MGNIVLSADSTCDLGDELKQRNNVHFFPYHIIFRGKDYLDNVTIFPERLYAGYYEDKSLPSTSAINVQEYVSYFQPFVDAGQEVIHLNLGGALSASHENAKAAAKQLHGVHVIDSYNLSTGIALQVIRAGKLIEQGLSAEEIVADIEAMRPRVHSSFILDTLDFMAAGGRCPQVLAYVAAPLKLKPQIMVNNADGSMSVGKIRRGKLEHVLKKYVTETLQGYPDVICDDIFITHSGISQECIDIAKQAVRDAVPVENLHITQASCTISSHCGPNTLGVLFVTES
ncbi:MAG: DegV family protein [Coriobacteriia bacterium]|nr:DegV family protein [Coriobacteriia bacterium]